MDDDCSGDADVDYAATQTNCGVGACAATGTTSCAAGHEVDSCTPDAPAAFDATCDGVDDDCSGAADEDYAATQTNCGVGACAATGTTSCVAGQVVDSCTPGAPAGSDATCDGVDDDCSGDADEDYAATQTNCGVGACAATGTTSCAAGHEVDSCTPGAPAGSDATCDGVDDDCSGAADEDYAATQTNCGVGACTATGTTSCAAGHEVDSCTPSAPAPSDTTCDGVDDDCSGAADEDYVTTPTSCGVGACAATGTTSCAAGQVVDSCTPGAPAPSDTTCDGVDDDCSGAADEDYAATQTNCGVGACAATGTTSCVAGQVVDSCTPGAPAGSDATCDGVDDDCSGAADEDYVTTPTSCGVGACAATGTTSCAAGQVVDSCTPGAPAPSDTTCDGVDDDCSGDADEDYAATQTNCGVGACAATGTTSCAAGQVVDSCTPGAPAGSDATCDGVDDDCSGAADEDYAATQTNCGVGACAATGTTSCVAGHEVDSCTPGVPDASDATCDGVDDDCSGDADEDYAATQTNCGVGACAATGTTSCAAGQVVDSCTPGAPAASDATCDGVDDDCSGAADEDYAATQTNCGVGACAATGTTSCAAGQVVDSCTPGVPDASDATCDGVDDDCSGAADEDYVTTPTSCGVGACAATGTTSCAAGQVVDSCTPGAPAPSDATCDGVDDDCSGDADEDYAATQTNCGVGACAATGTTSCVAGHEVDSCTPGAPAASDATCDGVDDDCSGDADEDYAATQTNCGVGACAATGTTSCVAGQVVDSCTPGAGSSEICNNIDDDCDGSVDDGGPALCDNSAWCDGQETCAGAAGCSPGTPPDCDDAVACTVDSCDEASDACFHSPADAACDDGQWCNGSETCDLLRGCAAGSPPNCDDGLACTVDTCAGSQCLHAPACAVGGSVFYFRANSGEPAAITVPGVPIDSSADGRPDVATDDAGAYAVTGLAGPVVLETVGKWGTPRAADHNGAITSFDASLIARASVLLTTLSPNQVLAADVTGNGFVSSFDASQVASFAVEIVNHFKVASDTGSDWKFLRCDSYAYPGDPGCGPPKHAFAVGPAEPAKDFYGILYGDVTGNWRPATGPLAAAPPASVEEQEAARRDRALAEDIARGAIPRSLTRSADRGPAVLWLQGWAPMKAGQTRVLTVALGDADGILGLDLLLAYRRSHLEVLRIEPAGIGSRFFLATADDAGQVRIAAYGYTALAGSGPVLEITVKALADTSEPPTVDGDANEGGIPLRVARPRAVNLR